MSLFKKTKRLIACFLALCLMLGNSITNIYAAYTQEQAINVLSQKSNKRSVLYYGDWSVWGGQGNFYPDHMAADQITHLNFAFLDFDARGNLIFTDKDAAAGNPLGQSGVTWGDVNAGVLPALVELRSKNPNLKIGVSLGGWSKSGDFSDMAANSSTRAKFVENVIKFIEYTNMDFVDVDWEYPAFVRQPDLVDNKNDEGTPNSKPADKANYILLLEDLRVALDNLSLEKGKDYELSVALPASRDKLEAGVDIKRMFEVIDFGNLMTYDMRGAWDDKAAHQTALYQNENDPHLDAGLTVSETVSYMIEKGAPAEKLVVGAAYYTRGWEKVTGGTDAKNPGLYGNAAIAGRDADLSDSRGALNLAPITNGDGGRRGGVWSYGQIDKLKSTYSGVVEYWDDTAKAPYLYDINGGAFFTYDNVRSIEEKAKYVNQNNLGGIIGWMVSQDKQTSSGKRDQLTKATKNALFGNAALPVYDIVYSDVDISVTITPFKESWGNSGGYEISIKNNERLQESNEVLATTEKMAETITLPKLYIKTNGQKLSSGDYKAGTVTTEGEYTVVDFGSVYDGKAVEPGQTYTFRLKSNVMPQDVSAIESIDMIQRINKTGSEIKRQTIYGETQNKAPQILGANNVTLTVGDNFNALAGVTAFDKEDGDITSRITIDGTVNTNAAGVYVLTYKVFDSKGLSAVVSRTVKVEEKVNSAPQILGANNVTLTVGDNFNALTGVTAFDKEDGDITSRITIDGTVNTNVAGVYELTYKVSDSEGLSAVVLRTVTVEEKVNSAPQILGANNVTLTVGDKFNALTGVTAFDKEDGDITSSITINGTVNTNVAGIYTLTYSVEDSAGAKTSVIRNVTVKDKIAVDTSFGVGQGILWPEQVNAPYVDMSGWVTINGYNNSGAPNLLRLSEDTGVMYMNLGFIQSVGSKIKDNKLVWGFGGYEVLSEGNDDNQQYQGIKKSIRELREIGGDVAISFGGLNGTAFWEATQDVEILTNTYLDIVNGFGLTRLDLDVEGGAQNKQKNIANAKAIKNVQEQTGVQVVLTLPVLPTGLTSVGLGVLEAYLEQGVDISVVNIMTMCYGNANLLPGENYGTASLRAVDSTKDQIVDKYKKILGKVLTDKEAYAKLGTTPSIGFEGAAHPVFIAEWAEIIVEHAIDRELAMTSFWSLNRDAMFDGNSGIKFKYEFTDIFSKFASLDDENRAPVIKGADDVIITVGDNFNALAGVSALDKEDGDLTGKIVVSGTVDTTKAGVYTLIYTVTDSEGVAVSVNRKITVNKKANKAPVILGATSQIIVEGDKFSILEGVTARDEEDGDLTDKIVVSGTVDTTKPGVYRVTYTVSDSEGLKTIVNRDITVKAKPDPNNTYDPTKIYNNGDKVTYNGKEYTAKWWTRGDIPGQSAVWELEVTLHPDGSQEYISGKVYNTGDVVIYNGQTYTAKWWTKSTPGSDSSWEKVETPNEDGSQKYVSGSVYISGDMVQYNGQTFRAKWWTKSIPGSDSSWELVK